MLLAGRGQVLEAGPSLAGRGLAVELRRPPAVQGLGGASEAALQSLPVPALGEVLAEVAAVLGAGWEEAEASLGVLLPLEAARGSAEEVGGVRVLEALLVARQKPLALVAGGEAVERQGIEVLRAQAKGSRRRRRGSIPGSCCV